MLKFITHRPFWVNLLAGFVLAIVFFFMIVLSLKLITHHGKSRTVPAVTGKNFDEAQKTLNGLGFDVVVQDSIYLDSLPRFTVIKQVPDGDAVVKVNRTVYLTINRAVPPVVEMPNLIGYSFRNAAMVLKNMGLRLGDTSFKSDFARNSVLEQWYNGDKIAAGTKLQMGTTISLVLGSGIGETEFVVPNLIGKTYGLAKSMLESNGLVINPIAPGISDTMNAFVIKQNPEQFAEDGKRSRIRPGQMIDVWLSTIRPIIDSSESKNTPQF
jgi:beta-lactam-binding protein with PASTA domain